MPAIAYNNSLNRTRGLTGAHCFAQRHIGRRKVEKKQRATRQAAGASRSSPAGSAIGQPARRAQLAVRVYI